MRGGVQRTPPRTVSDGQTVRWLLLRDRVVQRVGVPADLDVRHSLAVATADVGVPQRDGRQVLEQDALRVVELLVQLVDRAGRGGVVDLLVQLGVGVVPVVRAGAGVVQRLDEVVQTRVVGLPTATERAGDGAVRDVGAQRREGRVRLALRVDAQRVLDAVAHRVDPRLVRTVGVVGDGERAAPRGDGVGLLPQVLGLGGVELQDLVALDVLRVPGDGRRGEVLGRRAGVLEDRLGDGRAVDGHRDGLAAQRAFLTREVGQVLRDGERLEDSRRLVERPVTQVRLVGRQRARRNLLEDVERTGEEVVVGSLGRLVELQGQAAVLRLAGTLVVLVRNEVDLHVVLPGGVRLEHVRAVRGRSLAEPGDVGEGGVGHRVEGDVAELQREVGLRTGELHGEVRVVDDGETGHRLRGRRAGRDGVIALDGGVEGAQQRRVRRQGAPVPGVDEVLRRDRGTVRPLLAALDGDVVVDLVLGLDGLGQVVVRLTLGVVVHEARDDGLDDLGAARLVRVRRNEGVLRLAGPRRHDPLTAGAALALVAGARVAVARARCEQECRGSRGRQATTYAGRYRHPASPQNPGLT